MRLVHEDAPLINSPAQEGPFGVALGRRGRERLCGGSVFAPLLLVAPLALSFQQREKRGAAERVAAGGVQLSVRTAGTTGRFCLFPATAFLNPSTPPVGKIEIV